MRGNREVESQSEDVLPIFSSIRPLSLKVMHPNVAIGYVKFLELYPSKIRHMHAAKTIM